MTRLCRHPVEACHCRAYPFPHRAGSGKCQGPGEFVCTECGHATAAKLADLGIGQYEYWGAKCVDSRPAWVSECCLAPLAANLPSPPPATPPEKDYPE